MNEIGTLMLIQKTNPLYQLVSKVIPGEVYSHIEISHISLFHQTFIIGRGKVFPFRELLRFFFTVCQIQYRFHAKRFCQFIRVTRSTELVVNRIGTPIQRAKRNPLPDYSTKVREYGIGRIVISIVRPREPSHHKLILIAAFFL